MDPSNRQTGSGRRSTWIWDRNEVSSRWFASQSQVISTAKKTLRGCSQVIFLAIVVISSILLVWEIDLFPSEPAMRDGAFAGQLKLTLVAGTK